MRLSAALLASPFLPFLLISSLALNIPPTSLISLSTTNLTLAPSLTDDRAECIKITDPPMVGLNPTHCEVQVPVVCERLTTPRPEIMLRDQWIWHEKVGCVIGYYLPRDGEVPSRVLCEQVFGEVLDLCARNSRFNAGMANVLVVPDFSGDGEAIREGEIRYMMAPERLTLPHPGTA